jgi:hypothetical protein
MHWHTAAIALVLACACSGHPGSGGRPIQATAVLPDVPFAQLDHDQRVQFMKERVVPAMQPIFQQHDAKRFADFGCKTCHGERTAGGDFAMPTGELPALHFEDLGKHERADVEWMAKTVRPAMAKLVRVADAEFGCKHCHQAAVD